MTHSTPPEPRWLTQGDSERVTPDLEAGLQVSEAEYQARCWDRFVFRLEAAQRAMEREQEERGLKDRAYYGTMCSFAETLFWARAEAKLWRETEKRQLKETA